MHLLLVALLRLRRAVKVCRQIATSSRIDELVAEFDQQIPGLQLRHVWPRSVNTTAQEGRPSRPHPCCTSRMSSRRPVAALYGKVSLTTWSSPRPAYRPPPTPAASPPHRPSP